MRNLPGSDEDAPEMEGEVLLFVELVPTLTSRLLQLPLLPEPAGVEGGGAMVIVEGGRPNVLGLRLRLPGPVVEPS